MNDCYSEKHERASAEFVRSSKDAISEYERDLKDPFLSSAQKRAVQYALAVVRKQLAQFGVTDEAVELPTWIC